MKYEYRYAAYISGKGQRIKKILESSEIIAQKLRVVISDDAENLYLKDFLESQNIDYIYLNIKQYEKENRNQYFSNEMLRLFLKYHIDYCFSFGKHILCGKLLDEYKNRIINFHPSLLPHFGGFQAIDNAVNAGVHILGNTAHFIDETVDAGPIILQTVTSVNNFYMNGYDAILDEQITLVLKIDKLLSQGRIHVINNKVQIDEADYSASYTFPNI